MKQQHGVYEPRLHPHRRILFDSSMSVELLGAGSGRRNDADGNSLLELMRVSVPGNLGEECNLKLILAWSRSDLPSG